MASPIVFCVASPIVFCVASPNVFCVASPIVFCVACPIVFCVASPIVFDIAHKMAADILRYAAEESIDKYRTLFYVTARCNVATVRDTANQTRLPTLPKSTNGMYVAECGPLFLQTSYAKLYCTTKHVLQHADAQSTCINPEDNVPTL